MASSDYLYRHPPLFLGILIKRYKRFFVDVELTSGEIVTAHCPNTKPMTGVSTLGSTRTVMLSKSDNEAIAPIVNRKIIL